MMLDVHLPAVADMELYTDTSGSHGFGATAVEPGSGMTGSCARRLNQGSLWQELFAVIVACLTWGKRWSGKRVLFHCDNQSIVDLWQQGSSRCPSLMHSFDACFYGGKH